MLGRGQAGGAGLRPRTSAGTDAGRRGTAAAQRKSSSVRRGRWRAGRGCETTCRATILHVVPRRTLVPHPPPPARRARRDHRRRRRRRGVGARPPDRAVHQPVPVPPVGLDGAELQRPRPRRPLVVVAAVLGAAVVSLLARWSPIIRGHGIPEAMEAVLVRQSRVAPRTAIAKPLSAAVAIGTGGPFGAEGPIIVTGGALGSLARPGPARVGERAQDPARRAAPRPAWRRRSARRSPPSCWRSSCCCSSSRREPSSRSSSRPASPAPSTPPRSAPGRCSRCRPTTSPASRQLPWFAAARHRAAALLATLIARGLFAVERAYRRLPIGEFVAPDRRRRRRGRRSACSCRGRSASATT